MVKLLVAILAGCTAAGLDAPAPQMQLDRDYFRCDVEPVLEARCAFPACHGSARRPLSLFAVGRMRDGVTWDRPKAPLTATELAENFRVASGFGELLVQKPLDVAAGGYFHRGAQLYGVRDVFRDQTDAGYQLIANWLADTTASASCAPTTEIGP